MKAINVNIFMVIAVLLASCGCNKGTGGGDNGGREVEKPVGDVEVWVTNTTRAYDFTAQAVDFGTGTNMSPNTITLEPSTRYQTMWGFGAAVTGSTCYNLLQMDDPARRKFLEETFSPTDGMGHSYIRISIGCSDFSLSEYSLCDLEGIENFAFTHEELDYVIPVLREILEINPDIAIMGSPWTPPRWMKTNNEWTSGELKADCYDDYALYFVKWIQTMAQYGIEITSVTPQNEPLNRGNSASMFMGWEEQLIFVRDHLGPQLRAAELDTKIYLFDHNYNYDNMADQTDYPVKIYNDDTAAGYAAGAAYHNYGGVNTELDDIHTKRPDKELVFTETSIGTWNDGRNLEVRLMDDMEQVALGTVNRWCSAVIVWNLMLDNERGPNRQGGCRTCYGAVDISKANYADITRNSHYYIIGHMSSVVKPGAVRIATSGYNAAGIVTSAFENADGSYAFVLLNKNAATEKITVSAGGKYFSYTVPAKSVVSFRWKTN